MQIKLYVQQIQKEKTFLLFKNITLFKPNLKEVKESLHILNDEVNEKTLSSIHQELKEKLKSAHFTDHSF